MEFLLGLIFVRAKRLLLIIRFFNFYFVFIFILFFFFKFLFFFVNFSFKRLILILIVILFYSLSQLENHAPVDVGHRNVERFLSFFSFSFSFSVKRKFSGLGLRGKNQ